MRNINPTKVILSAYSKERSKAQNERADSELIADLMLLESVESFRDVEGRYGGHKKCSHICFLRPGSIQEGIDELTNLAAEYLQSNILVIHGDNAAEVDGKIVGTFQAVTKPKRGEDFTKYDGIFYVVR